MGPIAISFGLASAAVLVIAALFSTRHNRNVAAFLGVMWVATKVWNYRTGTDAQIYLDTALALFCGLLCVVVMHKDRRSLWPLVTLGVMATWITLNAGYADVRDQCAPWVKTAYQIASNVLFGVALFANALPGGKRGCLAFLCWVPVHHRFRSRLSPGNGWAAPAVKKRRV